MNNITVMKLMLLLSIFFFVHNVKGQKVTLSGNSYWAKSIYLPEDYWNNKGNYANTSLETMATKKNGRKNQLVEISKSTIFSKLFLKLYGAYGFLTPGSYSVQSTNNFTLYDNNGDQHDTTIKSQGRKGIGSGLRFGVGVGYVLNDFLNLGIDAEYVIGTKLTNTLSSSSDAGYFFSSTNDQINYKALTLSPHIVFKALAKPNYFIYNKLGILLTLPYTLNTSGNSISSWAYNWKPDIADSSFKTSSKRTSIHNGQYKISLGIGFNVAFGVNFRINDKLRAFGEIFGNFSALTPSSSKVITTTNQVDSVYQDNKFFLVANTDYATVNTTYQTEGLTINNLINDTIVPGGREFTYADQAKKFTVNMNVMGISAGIIYRF